MIVRNVGPLPELLKCSGGIVVIFVLFLLWSGKGCGDARASIAPPSLPATCSPQEGSRQTQEDPEAHPEIAALTQAHHLRLPHDRVLLTRMLGGKPGLSEVVHTIPQPAPTEVSFWVANLSHNENRQMTAVLRYAGPVALVYVEPSLRVSQRTLEQAVRTFENDIYPRSRSLFGSEWQPGVDGDTRITLLHVQQDGDATVGYFAARDSVPREAHRLSNEREMVVMKISPDHPSYFSVLAHEMQHMIHWNEQRRSQTWFNEGCSMLNQDLNGYPDQLFAQAYLAHPNTQLTSWSATQANSLEHYGAANLFLRYLYAHYIAPSTGEDNRGEGAVHRPLQALLRSDASNQLTAFVELAQMYHPDITSFAMLVGNWAVANMVNDRSIGDGRYGYPPKIPPLPRLVTPQEVPFDRGSGVGRVSGTLAQFGAAYWDLPAGPLHITFTGSLTVPLVGAFPADGWAWWSGRGDGIISTLTRSFDFRSLTQSKPVLRFHLWYHLEREYDYAFVSVSTDGGNTWQVLPGLHTTQDDPHGAHYGHGWSGMSGEQPGKPEWVEEVIDLSPYVGKQGEIRFWLTTDEAINLPGVLVDHLRLCDASRDPNSPGACIPWEGETHSPREPEVSNGLKAPRGSGEWDGWQSGGFVPVDGDLPQWWEIRLVRSMGGEKTVERLLPDGQNRFSTTLAPHEQGTLVIVPTTPHTTEPASYQVVVASSGEKKLIAPKVIALPKNVFTLPKDEGIPLRSWHAVSPPHAPSPARADDDEMVPYGQ